MFLKLEDKIVVTVRVIMSLMRNQMLLLMKFNMLRMMRMVLMIWNCRTTRRPTKSINGDGDHSEGPREEARIVLRGTRIESVDSLTHTRHVTLPTSDHLRPTSSSDSSSSSSTSISSSSSSAAFVLLFLFVFLFLLVFFLFLSPVPAPRHHLLQIVHSCQCHGYMHTISL
jgi:hypothetical protein